MGLVAFLVLLRLGLVDNIQKPHSELALPAQFAADVYLRAVLLPYSMMVPLLFQHC